MKPQERILIELIKIFRAKSERRWGVAGGYARVHSVISYDEVIDVLEELLKSDKEGGETDAI